MIVAADRIHKLPHDLAFRRQFKQATAVRLGDQPVAVGQKIHFAADLAVQGMRLDTVVAPNDLAGRRIDFEQARCVVFWKCP